MLLLLLLLLLVLLLLLLLLLLLCSQGPDQGDPHGVLLLLPGEALCGQHGQAC
jgi:hypothetical protein